MDEWFGTEDKKSLTSIVFFSFTPLEEEKRTLYNVFPVFRGRLRCRSPSSWSLYECEFIWCAELREAAFPAAFNSSLIPGTQVWRFKWWCSLAVPWPTSLYQRVFTSASSKTLQPNLQKFAGESHLRTWYQSTSANALFPRNLWKEKALIVQLIWRIFG